MRKIFKQKTILDLKVAPPPLPPLVQSAPMCHPIRYRVTGSNPATPMTQVPEDAYCPKGSYQANDNSVSWGQHLNYFKAS